MTATTVLGTFPLSPHWAAALDRVDRSVVDWLSNGRMGDPASRLTRDWALVKLPDALAICFGYLAVIFLLSVVMKLIYGSEEPKTERGLTVLQKFQKEPILVLQALYNPIQVALCGWMVANAILEARKRNFSGICNPFEPEKHTGIATVEWVFYLTKALDFVDTVFIVLRRKWRQLSFLHVYHHSTIWLVYWGITNGAYDGDIFNTIVLNGSIHFIMYSYYMMRTFNLPVPMALKMLITKLQMIQFVIMISSGMYLLYAGCDYPSNLCKFYIGYILTMLYLFNDFNKKAYTGAKGKGSKKKKKKKAKSS